MDAKTIQTQIDDDRTEWAKLTAILDAHPKGPLHDPESPDWTARDVYTHLAHMMEWTARAIERTSAGETVHPDPKGMTEDEYNAHLRDRYAHISLDEAREMAQKAFQHRESAIAAVPLDRWDDELTEVASHDGADHFRGHMSYLVVD